MGWPLWCGCLLIAVSTAGSAFAAPFVQVGSSAQTRAAGTNPGRRPVLPPRRGTNLKAAPLPGQIAPGSSNRAPSVLAGADSNSSSVSNAARSPKSTKFPYQVTTINPRTPIRSMPSDDAYATATVGPQTPLEVWRHDPNGWLAIRPPDGSFALVDAKHLKATNDPDVFTVSTDRAKAWVGTQIDEDHTPISQVRMKLGEKVAVISSLIIEEQNGAQTWYQIEPPAGEFRWVHQDDLQSGGREYSAPPASEIANRPKPPVDAPMSGYMPPLTGNAANTNPASGLGPGSATVPELDLDPAYGQVGFGGSANSGAANSGATNEQNSDQWRAAQQTTTVLDYADPRYPSNVTVGEFGSHPASHSTFPDPSSADSLVQPLARQDSSRSNAPPSPGDAWDAAVNRLRQDPVANAVADASLAGGQPSPSPTPNVNPSVLANYNPPMVVTDWNQQLAWVQSRLNQDTAQAPQQWNLVPLLTQCQAMWHSAPTKEQQEAVASVGRRIEAMLQLQHASGNNIHSPTPGMTATNNNDPWAGQRFASNGSFVGSGVTPSTGNSPSNTSPATAPQFSIPPTNVAYDAVGYLKELIIERGQRSNEYVLQDNNGRSICHISAQPGVNLNNFLDKKVGVMGIRGVDGKRNLPHISVERIYQVQ